MHFKQASPPTQPRDFHAHGSFKPLPSSKTQPDFQGLETLRKQSIMGRKTARQPIVKNVPEAD